MTIKIKLILAAGALLAGAWLTWYVQGLRADSDRLNTELQIAQAVVSRQAINLGRLKQASQIISAGQTKATSGINTMNKELANAKSGKGTERGINDITASQLSRLFNN